MGGGKYKSSFDTTIWDFRNVTLRSVTLSCSVFAPQRQAGNTIHDQVFPSQRSGLVKAGNVDSARKWYSERFCAEDGITAEGSKTCIDGQIQFHWKFGWHNARDDQDTVQQKLRSLAVFLHPFLPNVPGCSNREDQQEENEPQSFSIVGRDSFCRENHCPDQTALIGLKSSLNDYRHCTFIWRWWDARCESRNGIWGILRGAGVCDLQDFCASVQERILVQAFRLNRCCTR